MGLTDNVHVTRLPEHVKVPRDIFIALCDETESGEYAHYPDLETIGDLKKLGRDKFQARFPQLSAESVNSLFTAIGEKRKPGRPRKPQ